MRIFVSGGCKNGKSTYAQDLAAAQRKLNAPLYYIATMIPTDDEDHKRILRHIDERSGMDFTTLEIPTDIHRLTEFCTPGASFLLDSVTALLANEMFSAKGINPEAADKICDELQTVIPAAENIVIVSDYIYSDAAVYDSLTEEYRKKLAMIDKTCAKLCDVVLEVSYGSLIIHKGAEQFETLH